MKVLVMGATGTIGKLAVENLVAGGHHVTAFARRPEKLDICLANVTLWPGDAMSELDVSDAVRNHDAVVITLGSGMSRKSKIRSRGTLNAIRAMQKHGVNRLIVQSTLGAHESWGNLNFFWKRIMFGALLRPVFLDHELQESLVRASGLDWTIVRPSAFQDGPPTNAFKTGFAPTLRGLKLKIARADVAQFLAGQLTDKRFHRDAVAISN